MSATFTIPLITVISGQTITASLWNNEFENIDTNFTPAGMDDMSGTDSAMQTTEDPYPGGATSRPTSLDGEVKRLRYLIAQITGETYWYIDPDTTLAALYARFPIQTADLGDSQVTTAKIADSNVTTAKIADSNVTTAKIADSNVTTAKINNAAVDENKLASSVAGSGLAGGAGTALSVNVDSSTIEINSDTLRVKDGGITYAKLASDVTSKLSPKTIQKVTGSSGSLGPFSGGAAVATATVNMTITAVDTSKAYILWNGLQVTTSSGTEDGVFGNCSVELTSATNVQFKFYACTGASGSSVTATLECKVTVVEWN